MRFWSEDYRRRRAIRRLIGNLLDPNPLVKGDSEEALAGYDADYAEVLISELDRTVKNRRQLPFQIAIIIGVIPFGVFNVVRFFGFDPSTQLTFSFAMAGLFIMIALSQSRTLRDSASRLLGGLEDLRAVSPLAEALERVNPYARAPLTSAIIRLLPKVPPELANTITPAAKAALNRALLGDEPMLIEAILKSLENIGDSSFIPNVRSLTKGKGRAAFDKQLREAALSCLSKLEGRSKYESERTTLLRASLNNSEPANVLLRAAASNSSVNAEQLLRPGSAAETA